jgi:hypothetical protein
MCVRNIQGKVENPWLDINEITFDQFKSWFSIDFVKQLNKLYMCGNTGDPIMSKDTLEIFNYLRENNSTMELSMNTNGSARTRRFWEQLAELNVRVIFGIDGLEDTHSLYRIGTDYNKILENASTFIRHGGHAEWHMLIFEHNKHQVGACQHNADMMGFKQFIAKNTSRFRDNQLNVLDANGKTTHILYPSDKSISITKKLEDNSPCTINCKVIKDKGLYIAANGLVSPCCWLDFNGINIANPSIVDFKDKGLAHPDLNINTLQEIFDSSFFNDIENTWVNDPLRQCRRQCGKVDKFNEQF